MIDLATAGLIAQLTANAVGAFDKIFRGYLDFVKKEPSPPGVPQANLSYVNSPGTNSIIAKSLSTGATYQTVTYEELRQRLGPNDRSYIETLSEAMDNYQRQWNSTYRAKSLAAPGPDIGRLEAILDNLAKEISEVLIRLLDFVKKLGLQLDDHYEAAMDIAQRYRAGRPA